MSDDGEQRRSIRTLATPLLVASRRWPAALSGTAWLMAAAIGCGLGRGLAALLYLTFSSDTNGGVHERRRHCVIAVGGVFVGVQSS